MLCKFPKVMDTCKNEENGQSGHHLCLVPCDKLLFSRFLHVIANMKIVTSLF